MQSSVSKGLAKSTLERNPDNKRGNVLHTKKTGAQGQAGDRKAELLKRFANIATAKK